MNFDCPVTVASLESWLKQFPAEAHVLASEGEIVVVVGELGAIVLHPLTTPVA